MVKKEQLSRFRNKLASGEDILIMMLGDSITYGMHHCTAEQTHVAVLTRCFAKNFSDRTVHRWDGRMVAGAKPLDGYEGPIVVQEGDKGRITVVRCGVGGDTVKRMLARKDDYIGDFVTGESPDLFTVLLGINDALSSDPAKFVTPDVFYSDYNIFLDLLADQHPKAEILLMTPTYNHSGKTAESSLDVYSDKVKQIAEERGLALIDTHRLWMEHMIVGGENYGQGDWLSTVKGDFAHYSPKGAVATAEFIWKELDL